MSCRYLLLLLFGLVAGMELSAQNVLQVERFGSLRKVRYMAGDEIEFQTTRLPGIWVRKTIVEIFPDEQVIRFEDELTNIQTITKVRRINDSWVKKVVVGFLYSSAVSTTIYSTLAWIFGTPPNWISITLATVPWGLGWLVNKIFKYNTYRIGKAYRLRALDLNFYPLRP